MLVNLGKNVNANTLIGGAKFKVVASMQSDIKFLPLFNGLKKQVSDMAVKDMADNSNKLGTSMESIQNAYQGFAKKQLHHAGQLKAWFWGHQNRNGATFS